MRSIFSALVLLLAGLSQAAAQSVPTYYATVINWTTVAGASDVACLEGAAGKVVKLNSLAVYGKTSVPGATDALDVMLVRRITLTQGASAQAFSTSGSPTHPVALSKLLFYTAVPSAVGEVDAPPKGFVFRRVRWEITNDFTTPFPNAMVALAAADPYTTQPEIRSATSAICINYASPAPAATVINVNMVWTETNQ